MEFLENLAHPGFLPHGLIWNHLNPQLSLDVTVPGL